MKSDFKELLREEAKKGNKKAIRIEQLKNESYIYYRRL